MTFSSAQLFAVSETVKKKKKFPKENVTRYYSKFYGTDFFEDLFENINNSAPDFFIVYNCTIILRTIVFDIIAENLIYNRGVLASTTHTKIGLGCRNINPVYSTLLEARDKPHATQVDKRGSTMHRKRGVHMQAIGIGGVWRGA